MLYFVPLHYEIKYAKQFCEDNSAPAVPFRMAMGSLIIKQCTSHSDEETLQDIVENPYLQYLIGMHDFSDNPPFAPSSMTNFKKYITSEMIKEISEYMFRSNTVNKNNDNNQDNK
jgi:hypothetical protein